MVTPSPYFTLYGRLLVDSRDGFLVDMFDLLAIRLRVVDALESADSLREMRHACCQKITTTYSTGRGIRAYERACEPQATSKLKARSVTQQGDSMPSDAIDTNAVSGDAPLNMSEFV